MECFVDQDSIVRKIWGQTDTILFIFAGSSAEFALNKAVDWLYFTGRLPADPIGRLFSTVSYARAIVFSENQAALQAIDSMAAIHAQVEAKRHAKIPDWAYRDVLSMLIDYSIRSFELLHRKLTREETNEIFAVFNRVGQRMGLNDLQETLEAWQDMRIQQLQRDLIFSKYTHDLFTQYRKHLGSFRFRLLLEAQALMAPAPVAELLRLRKATRSHPLIITYKLFRALGLDGLLKQLILPARHKSQIMALDMRAQRP